MEPKTLAELRKQYLDEHHQLYRDFTRLLTTLSFAFITLITALQTGDSNFPKLALKVALASQLVSLICGIVVHYKNMLAPIKHLEEAEEAIASATKPIELRRLPSKLQQFCFNAQILFFSISFIVIIAMFSIQ